MAAALPPTPWLQPPNTAQNYLHGYGLGQQGAAEQARIAEAQQRLQQQAQQVQMEMAMKQQELEKQHLMDQQRIEIARSYHEQQMALGQQKLEEAKKVQEQKAVLAARQYQEQQAYLQDLSVTKDPYGAISRHPGMFPNMSGFGSAMRPGKQAATPQELAEKADMALDADTYKKISGAKLKLQEELSVAAPKMQPQLQSQITDLTRQQNMIRQNRGLTRPQIPGVAAAAPATAGGQKGIEIVRDPKTGRLVVSGGEDKLTVNQEPQAPPLTEDMFPNPDNFVDQSGQPE